MQTVSLESLRAELQKLQREAIAAHSRAAGGDKSAAARRSQIMDEVAFVKVQIAELEVAEQADKASQQVELVAARVEASRALTEQVRTVLEQRVTLAADASRLATTLGETIKELMALHRAAGNEVRHVLPIEESISLDTDEIAVVRSVLSTLFDVAGVDHDEAMSSLESLNFGLQRRTEDVRATVEYQNTFLMSIRERSDRRWADYQAQVEASQQEAA